MKHFVKVIWVIIVYSVLNGCSNKNKTEKKPLFSNPVRTVIAGKIINPPDEDPVLMFIIDDIATARQIIDYSGVNPKDSIFRFVIDLYHPNNILIKYLKLFSVFVHPGDSLFLTVDGKYYNDEEKFFNNLTYSGDTLKLNKLLNKFYTGSKMRMSDYTKFMEFQKRCTPEEMKHYADSLRKENHKRFISFDSLYHPPEEFKRYVNISSLSNCISDLSLYPYWHAKYNGLNKDDVVNPSYYDYFENIKFTESDIICPSVSSIANSYVAGYVDKHLKEKLRSEGKARDTIKNNKKRTIYDVDFSVEQLRYIPEITKDTLLLQLSLCNIYGQKLQGMNYRFFEKNRDIFDKYITKPYLREPLLAYYNEVKYKCIKPEIASQAILDDLKETPAKKIYNRIIEKNKGKVIYLDCWETACSPCRAEMPYSKKLMAKLDTSQVAFVYICFNSRKETWKGLLTEWQLGGQQYYADRKQSKYLSKALAVNGFPHYLLIDADGNVVDMNLRPSNRDTYLKIKGLINK